MARGIPVTYVPARNTVLLGLALAHAETIGAEAIFVGVNAIDYSGYPDCRPEFLRAFDAAMAVGDRWLAADAAHMLAIVATDDGERDAWTRRGVEVAETSDDPTDAYWVGPLMNNLGWVLLEGGRAADALAAFERALEVRERDPAHPYEAEIARYAVAKALLALDRPDEALGLLERATTWADDAGTPDGFFHEALAEALSALSRDAEAAPHAARALELLADQDPSLADADERAERLRVIAGRGA
jgi:tetratricopeptide (TPR) repeat protein